MERESVDDQLVRLQKLFSLFGKPLVAELNQLIDQQLREFQNFLESEKVDELIAVQGPKLALEDVAQCGRGGIGRESSLATHARKTNKSVRVRLHESGNQH